MIIFNYRNFYKKFDPEIIFYSQKISYSDYEDIAQYIRMYIWKHLYKFDPLKSSLKYYVHLMVITGYRKAIYEKTRQLQFEEGFHRLVEDIPSEVFSDNYDEIIEKVLQKLKNKKEIIVFYAILYNFDKKYTEIAKILNMSYPVLLTYIKQIRLALKEVLNDNPLLK